jgi:hypothetical protein
MAACAPPGSPTNERRDVLTNSSRRIECRGTQLERGSRLEILDQMIALPGQEVNRGLPFAFIS